MPQTIVHLLLLCFEVGGKVAARCSFYLWEIVALDAATATTILSQGKIPYLPSCFNA